MSQLRLSDSLWTWDQAETGQPWSYDQTIVKIGKLLLVGSKMSTSTHASLNHSPMHMDITYKRSNKLRYAWN